MRVQVECEADPFEANHSNEARTKCQEISVIGYWRTFVIIDIDDAGILHVSCSPRSRAGVLSQATLPRSVQAGHSVPAAAPSLGDVERADTNRLVRVGVDLATNHRLPSNRAANSASKSAAPVIHDAANHANDEEEDKLYILSLDSTTTQIFSGKKLAGRIRSLDLWLWHLEFLLQQEGQKFTALEACNGSATELKRSEAHQQLIAGIATLHARLQTLRGAKLASSEDRAILLELQELWADSEKNKDVDAIRKRVQSGNGKKSEAVGLTKRSAFRKSIYSTIPNAYKVPGYKTTLVPLSDEVGCFRLDLALKAC